jgi:hypothetical protein
MQATWIWCGNLPATNHADRIEFTAAIHPDQLCYGLVFLVPLLSTPHCCVAVFGQRAAGKFLEFFTCRLPDLFYGRRSHKQVSVGRIFFSAKIRRVIKPVIHWMEASGDASALNRWWLASAAAAHLKLAQSRNWSAARRR